MGSNFRESTPSRFSTHSKHTNTVCTRAQCSTHHTCLHTSTKPYQECPSNILNRSSISLPEASTKKTGSQRRLSRTTLSLQCTTPKCINMRMKACNRCRASPIAGCLGWILALLRRGPHPRLPPADAVAHVALPSYTRRPTECVGQEGRHAFSAVQDSPLPRTRPAVREGNTKGIVECSPLG